MWFRYDPVHWGVPEGSYASDPNGPARIVEFRTMVQVQIISNYRLTIIEPYFSCYYYMILNEDVVYSGHQQNGPACGA